MKRNHVCDLVNQRNNEVRLSDVRCRVWQSSAGVEPVPGLNLSGATDMCKGLFARGVVYTGDRLRNIRTLRGDDVGRSDAFLDVMTIVRSSGGYDLVLAKGRL